MNRFIIIDGLPYLYDRDSKKSYAVRWDDEGFTVGSEVELTSDPVEIYSELSIMAQCAGCLDSIAAQEKAMKEPKTEKPKRATRKRKAAEQG